MVPLLPESLVFSYRRTPEPPQSVHCLEIDLGQIREWEVVQPANVLFATKNSLNGLPSGRLGSTTRRVLSVASVTGSTIDFDAVVTASGLDEDIVLDALDEATGAAIVRETPSGSYEFVHPLIQSTLYHNLGPARRHRRHLHIAEALLGRPSSDAVSISYHLDRAACHRPEDHRPAGVGRRRSDAAPCL